MAISGISGAGSRVGYMQVHGASINSTNNRIQAVGKEGMSAIAKVGNDRSRVSNFGTETRIGSSRVYKGNVEAMQLSKQSLSLIHI